MKVNRENEDDSERWCQPFGDPKDTRGNEESPRKELATDVQVIADVQRERELANVLKSLKDLSCRSGLILISKP